MRSLAAVEADIQRLQRNIELHDQCHRLQWLITKALKSDQDLDEAERLMDEFEVKLKELEALK